jgi:predicted SnoaL-like aldol condensation-catalyzing enzyme
MVRDWVHTDRKMVSSSRSLVHPDFHSNTAPLETSRDALKEYLGHQLSTSNDIEVTNLLVMTDGEMVNVLQRITATVDGERISVRSADFYRVQDGLLAEHWDAGFGYD